MLNIENLIKTEKHFKTELDNYLLSKIPNSISRERNRASDLGFECDTYQTLCRSKGELRPKISLQLKRIFRLGNEWEDPNFIFFRKAGLKIRQTMQQFRWDKFKISGRLDGIASIKHPENGKEIEIPVEHKTCSPNSFRAIKKYKEEGTSLIKASQMWLRKYPAQLMTYMLFKNIEYGLWFFFEKSNGDYFFWLLPLDYGYAESLIKRAERSNQNVKAGTIPKPKYCELCAQCPFALTYCFPDRDFGPGFELLDDESLEQKIKRMKELEGTEVKEYNSLKKILIGKKEKPGLLYQKNAVVGNYIIESKEYEKKAFSVDASTYFRTSIKELKPEEE